MKNKIELWQMYCYIKKLVAKKFRTNNIEGDFTEDLIADFYGGKLETASHKAYDFTVDSKRYQVKARVAKKGKITGSLSDIHHWEFDYLVVVLYNEDGTIKLVKELTKDEAEKLAYKNTGRDILSVSSIKRQEVGKDITAAIKAKYGI